MADSRRSHTLARAALLVLLACSPGGLRAETRLDPHGRIGPFTLSTEDGAHQVGIGFVGQLLFELTNAGGEFGGGGDRETDHSLRLRRVRSLVRASLLDGDLSLGFQLSTAPSSLELMDLWADVRFLPALRLRLGQFKTPFGRYRWVSFTRLVLVDWPIAAQRFGSERQIGVMIHSGQKDDTPFSYAFGVFAGYNARASFETALTRIYAEPMPNPSNLRAPAAPSELHPELVLRVAHSAPGIHAETNSDGQGGGFRHSVGLSVAWDARPVAYRDFALRVSPELLCKVHGFSFNVVGYLGFSEGTSTGSFGFAAWGLTGEAAWRFAERWEIALRYSRVDLLDDLRKDARARGDRIVGEASLGGLRPGLVAQYASAGAVDVEQELTLGFNVYLIGHSLKWQTDIAWLREESGPGIEDAIRVRTQAILAF